jgi:hypothetical protein
MASPVSTPHCPFDRLWQPGHPFRARSSRCRRWVMALLLIFMSAVVSCYWYLTDPERIRAMSQAYLSELVGGRVQIESASLSIFQGLKLSHISVKVDKAGPADDTNVFYADAIDIQYNPASLLRGRLQATRIIATGTRAQLVEDSVGGHWNYQRLLKTHRVNEPNPKPFIMPQLVFRDAEVTYGEVSGDHCVVSGSLGLQGNFFPSPDGRIYSFALQSRGNGGVGAGLSGQLNLKTGEAVMSLTDLEFGEDIQAMLPRQVREFWTAHQIQGALDIPEFRYTPANKDHRATFKVRTELQHVHLVVRAEEFDPPPSYSFHLRKPTPLAWVPTSGIEKVINETHRTLFRMHAFPEHPPLPLNDVSGSFIFDDKGIRIEGLSTTVAGATLQISGSIDGYDPDAAMKLRVESKPGQVVSIGPNPDILPALPSPLHQAYTMLMPWGSGTMWAEMTRPAGGAPVVNGELDIINGNFKCIFFPYPVRGATGKLRFFPDPSGKFEKLTLEDIHASGMVGGPNENCQVSLNGWVGAMDPDVGCRIRASGKHVQSEAAVFAAFPPPVRKAMKIFRGVGEEPFPKIAGDFDCEVYVPPGVEMRPIVTINLNFTDGAGKLADFPYPLENMHGSVAIRDGYLDLNHVHFTHGNSTVALGGRITWPVDLPPDAEVIAKPNVTVDARNVPVDATLLKVLPPDASNWLRTMGATGMLDVNGTITPKPNATDPKNSIQWDMDVAVRDGTAKPRGSEFAVSNITGSLTVHTDHLDVHELHAKRGEAGLNATATVDWSSGTGADVHIDGTGSQVQLEPALHDLLPPDAQAAWKTLDPHGVIDAHVLYHGIWPVRAADAVATISSLPEAPLPLPQPTLNEFNVTLKPTDVTVTPAPLPYRLDHCKGEITISPQAISVNNVQATHGKATVAISARGLVANPLDWDLTISAHNVPADKELCQALPQQVAQVIQSLKYTGQLSVDLTTFRYRGDKPDPDIDFAGTLAAADGAVDAGVPIDKINGSMPFTAAVRGGKLMAFRGDADLSGLNVSARKITDFHAALDLPNGSDVLNATGIHGIIAGGELAGEMALKFPDVGPASYSMNFAVKNADLAQLAQQTPGKGQNVQGQASGSLALQGQWTDPSTRRGRGDVLISGKEMYQIPLVLGLLEVTNLSLPTTSPFNEGTARYLVEGNRVTFEQLQMRSNAMVMSGNGWLDFGSKQVRMNFTTENPNIPQLPLVHDLWQGAKQELLQIQVRGTVQSPKVSAASMHTFTTTVDEVLNGKGGK